MVQEPDPAVDAGVVQERGAELSEFLRGRRARLKPSDVGLVDHGRYRRVPGLRREELAQLAGVSMAYYTRLEQGHVHNASPEILDAWAPLVIEDPERHGDVDPEARASSAAVTSAPAGSTCR